MNFEDILYQRQKYLNISCGRDEFYDVIINNTYKYDYVLLTVDIVRRNPEKIFKNRYADIIIQMPSPFKWTSANFILLHFVNIRPSKFLTGIFKGRIFDSAKSKKAIPVYKTLQNVENYTANFDDFLKNINLFIEGKSINRDDLNVNDYSIFDINNLNPFYYTNQAIKVRKELARSDYKLLSELADIIVSPTDRDIEGKYIKSKNFEHPLRYNELPLSKISRAIKLIKGDIIGLIAGEKPKFYLYNYDYNDVYAKSGSYCVIRVKDKNMSNYLVTYLNDEKARAYFSSNNMGKYIPMLTKSDLERLKIITPTYEMIRNVNESMEYITDSKKTSISKINEIIRNSRKSTFSNESQKIVSEDIINAITRMKNGEIKELINDDLKEVKICFYNKAYKSAIILCGSILEAILLDWLSEYEDTDDILDVATDNNGRDLGLAKIIFKLRELVRPYWYESSKAHEIRETRNMIHPKECIRNNAKADADKCQKIIDDLNDIIDSKESRS